MMNPVAESNSVSIALLKELDITSAYLATVKSTYVLQVAEEDIKGPLLAALDNLQMQLDGEIAPLIQGMLNDSSVRGLIKEALAKAGSALFELNQRILPIIKEQFTHDTVEAILATLAGHLKGIGLALDKKDIAPWRELKPFFEQQLRLSEPLKSIIDQHLSNLKDTFFGYYQASAEVLEEELPRCVISYVYPLLSEESWTWSFIEQLAADLNGMGIQVSFDNFSKQCHYQEYDYVIIIGTQSLYQQYYAPKGGNTILTSAFELLEQRMQRLPHHTLMMGISGEEGNNFPQSLMAYHALLPLQDKGYLSILGELFARLCANGAQEVYSQFLTDWQELLATAPESVKALATGLDDAAIKQYFEKHPLSEKNQNPLAVNLEALPPLQSNLNVKLAYEVPHQFLEPLLHYCQAPRLDSQAAKSPILITGLPGSGKTTLGETILRQLNDAQHYQMVWRLRADSQTALQTSLIEWAQAFDSNLQPQGKEPLDKFCQRAFKLLCQYLQGYQQWAVLFDNVETLEDIEPYFSQLQNLSKGQVIMSLTSRDATAAKLLSKTWEHYDLSAGLSEERAVILLEKLTGLNDPEGARTLAKYLEYLPLSLSTAGIFIKVENEKRTAEKQPLMSYAEYQALVVDKAQELEALQAPIREEQHPTHDKTDRTSKGYTQTQRAVIELSIRAAFKNQKEHERSLELFLGFICLIQSGPISRVLLKEYIKFMNMILPYMPKGLDRYYIKPLQKHSLLQRNSKVNNYDQQFHIHRVTQAVYSEMIINATMKDEGLRQLFFLQIIFFMEKLDKASREFNIDFLAEYTAHGNYLFEKFSGHFYQYYPDKLKILPFILSASYLRLGEYQKAKDLLEYSLANLNKLKSDINMELYILYKLAQVYDEQFEYAKKNEIQNKILTLQQQSSTYIFTDSAKTIDAEDSSDENDYATILNVMGIGFGDIPFDATNIDEFTDSFFNSIALYLNRTPEVNQYTAKLLRSYCHKFYLDNKDLVDSWNKDDLNIGFGPDEYYFIQYTQEELYKEFNNRPAIRGRHGIEGKILCRELKLPSICIAQLLWDTVTNQAIFEYYLADENGYNQIHNERDIQKIFANEAIPKLVTGNNGLNFRPVFFQSTLDYLQQFANQTKMIKKQEMNEILFAVTQAELDWDNMSYTNFDEAKLLLEQLLLKLKKHLNSDDELPMAHYKNSLAKLYSDFGNSVEAIKLLEEARYILKRYNKENHVGFLQINSNLAIQYRKSGRIVEAETLLKNILINTETFYGKDHIKYAQRLFDLAVIYIEQSRYHDAISFLQHALTIAEASNNKFLTARIFTNLVLAHISLNNTDEIIKLTDRFEEILEVQKTHIINPDDVAACYVNFAGALKVLKLAKLPYSVTARLKYLKAALEIEEQHKGRVDIDVGGIYYNIGEEYFHANDWSNAIYYFEKSLSIYEPKYKHDRLQLMMLICFLGEAYYYIEDYNKSIPMIERALPMIKQTYGKVHASIIFSYGKLYEAYKKLTLLHKAKEIAVEVLPIYEEYYGNESVEIEGLLYELAYTCTMLGDLSALSYLQRAVAITEKLLTANHIDLGKPYLSLGSAYLSSGQIEQGLKNLQQAQIIANQHSNHATSNHLIAVADWLIYKTITSPIIFHENMGIMDLNMKCFEALGRLDYQTSLAYEEDILLRMNDVADLWATSAYTYLALGNSEEAEILFNIGLTCPNKNANFNLSYSLYLLHKHDIQRANEQAQLAMKNDNENITFSKVSILFLDAQLAHLIKGDAKYPSNWLAWYVMSRCQKYEILMAALAKFQAALETKPDIFGYQLLKILYQDNNLYGKADAIELIIQELKSKALKTSQADNLTSTEAEEIKMAKSTVSTSSSILFPQPKANQTFDRWYNAQDIDKLLKHYLAANSNIECLPGIWDTDNSDKENRLFAQLQAFEQLQRKKIAYGEAVKDIVIIPVNLHQTYCALIYISYPQNATELPTIIYFNPLGGEVNNIIKQALSRLHRDVEINNLSMAMPSSDDNCVPWIIEAARNLAESGYIPDFNYDIQAARTEHEVIIKQQVSNLSKAEISTNTEVEDLLAEKSTISSSTYSLFPQPKVNQSLDKWYNAQDIDKLLKHYLAANSNIECLPGILGTDNNEKENRLFAQLQAFEQLQRKKIAYGEAVKDIAIIPVNLHQMYWAFVYISYPLDAIELPTIIYFDPSNGEVNNIVKQALNRLYKDVEINNLSMVVQSDDDNCGPWIVEAARNLAELCYIPEADYDIQTARREHQMILQGNPQQQTSMTFK